MSPDVNTMKTLEILINREDLDPDQWINFPEYGFRQYFLFKNTETGASIAILEYEKGGRIPVKHVHASNQFMYCLEGDYEYTAVGLRLNLAGRIAGSTAEDYEAIVSASLDAQKRWRMVPAPTRGEFVRRIGELVEENMEMLAAVVMLDTGKSLMEAKGELKEVVDMATLSAGQARMMDGFT